MTSAPIFATYPSLQDRTAFVSGGASGLGAEFVTQLAGQGARVAFIDIDVNRGRALERDLRARRCRRLLPGVRRQERGGSSGVHCSSG